MSGESDHDVTRLLAAIGEGDGSATDQLLPLIYDELRHLAARQMDNEPPGHTLQPTALVHEAYLRLVGDADAGWDSRGHFYVAAARSMRRILVEHARGRGRLKRGGGRGRIPLGDVEMKLDTEPVDLLALDQALTELHDRDPRMHDVVMLRHFAGLTNEQAGNALGISARSVRREWGYARLWLVKTMRQAAPESEQPDVG